MSDRELLELAAKAADIGPLDFDYAQREGHGLYFGPRLPLPQEVFMAANYTYWNPLEDDGDALCLAVKLSLRITTPIVDTATVSDQHEALASIVSDGDHYAAVRRAIVVASAEIGKGK